MTSHAINLYLDHYLDKTEKALIGRSEGKKLLKKIKSKVTNIENGQKFVIFVPERIITMNNSFFQGFLGSAVRNSGGAEEFLKKYEFKTSEHIKKHVSSYANYAMFEAAMGSMSKMG